MTTAVDHVSQAITAIHNQRVREEVARQAVAAHEKWLKSPAGFDTVLRLVLEAGYSVAVEKVS